MSKQVKSKPSPAIIAASRQAAVAAEQAFDGQITDARGKRAVEIRRAQDARRAAEEAYRRALQQADSNLAQVERLAKAERDAARRLRLEIMGRYERDSDEQRALSELSALSPPSKAQ
jgi:hypothetical protein